jgi:hypothetical protein
MAGGLLTNAEFDPIPKLRQVQASLAQFLSFCRVVLCVFLEVITGAIRRWAASNWSFLRGAYTILYAVQRTYVALPSRRASLSVPRSVACDRYLAILQWNGGCHVEW